MANSRSRSFVAIVSVLAALVLLVASIKALPARADSEPFKVLTPQQLKDLISANKGKVVYLNFFSTYCVPCQA